jgi:hypothetical protein
MSPRRSGDRRPRSPGSLIHARGGTTATRLRHGHGHDHGHTVHRALPRLPPARSLVPATEERHPACDRELHAPAATGLEDRRDLPQQLGAVRLAHTRAQRAVRLHQHLGHSARRRQGLVLAARRRILEQLPRAQHRRWMTVELNHRDPRCTSSHRRDGTRSDRRDGAMQIVQPSRTLSDRLFTRSRERGPARLAMPRRTPAATAVRAHPPGRTRRSSGQRRAGTRASARADGRRGRGVRRWCSR